MMARRSPRYCEVCEKQLGRANKTGLCRKHYGAVHNGALMRDLSKKLWQDPEYRKRVLPNLRKRWERQLEWCPLEYRPDYFVLTRKCKTRADDARAEITAQIANDTERYLVTGQLQQARRG